MRVVKTLDGMRNSRECGSLLHAFSSGQGRLEVKVVKK